MQLKYNLIVDGISREIDCDNEWLQATSAKRRTQICSSLSYFRPRLPAGRYLKWLRAGGTFVIRHSSVTPAHSTSVLPLARCRVCGRCAPNRVWTRLCRVVPRYCRLFNFACFLGRPLCFERFNLNRTQTVSQTVRLFARFRPRRCERVEAPIRY